MDVPAVKTDRCTCFSGIGNGSLKRFCSVLGANLDFQIAGKTTMLEGSCENIDFNRECRFFVS